MRKILVAILGLSLMFAGCSKDKTGPNLVCSYSETDSGVVISYHETYENDGSTITKAEFLYEYTAENENVFNALVEYYNKQKEILENYDGITNSVEILDDKIIFTTIIDFSLANNEKLVELGILSSVDVTKISLEMTKEGLETEGYTCLFDTIEE